MKKLTMWALGLATTAVMGCAKTVDQWGSYQQKLVEDIGYVNDFTNITAPGSVGNVTFTKKDGSLLQFRYAVNGRYKSKVPNAYDFVRQANLKTPTGPTTTTDFYKNENSIVEFEDDKKIYRLRPENNALLQFKGNNLKADSLNRYVMQGILNSGARWDIQ